MRQGTNASPISITCVLYAFHEWLARPRLTTPCGASATDPAYAAEAGRLALADAVSVIVVRYRAERGLTQTAFAAMVGWKQPHVARLEGGDVTPALETHERRARVRISECDV